MSREHFDFIELTYEFPMHYPPPRREDYYLFPVLIAKQMGMNPAIFTIRTPLTPRKREEINGIDVFRFNSIFSLMQQLIRMSPELVHGHSFGWIPATLAPLLARRYVFTPHVYRLDIYPKWKVELALFPLKKSDAIITRTKFEAHQLAHAISTSKIHVIPLPIDWNYFSQLREEWKWEIFGKYGLDTKNRLILCVTNLRPIKNLETLIRSFVIVKKEIPSSKLIIVGGELLLTTSMLGPAKPKWNYRLKLEKLIDSLGVKDVIFTGYQNENELRKFYAASEVFCMPSKVEGQCLSAGEAASAGLPLVLSNLETLVEIYQGCALFHEPSDHLSLAKNILNILENPKLAKKLGRIGKRKMQNYRPDIIYKKLRELYENLLRIS
jgi:glycosyltransferase involved in cell wall biosynthesis